MIKSKLKGLKKSLLLSLVFATVTGGCVTSMLRSNELVASAHNSYFVAITYDDANNQLMPVVVSEDNDFFASGHKEGKLANFSKYTVEDNTGKQKSWSVPSAVNDQGEKLDADSLEKLYDNIVADGDGDEGLVFTFPGVHGRGGIGCLDKIDANGIDESLAYTYADEIVGGMNKGMDFILSFMNTKNLSNSKVQDFYRILANDVESKKSSTTINGQSFSLTYLNSTNKPSYVANNLVASNYVRISKDGKSVDVAYTMNKGYYGDNPIRETTKTYKDGLKKYHDPEYIGWKYAVLQANYNRDVKHTTFSSVSEITKPNQLTLYFTDMINSTLSGLRRLLGLYEMNELMLNEGNRSTSYYYGIMPNTWKSSATLLHVVCLSVSWMVLIGAIIKILINRSLATINVTQRISMMEGIRDLISTCILLAVFPLIFVALAKLNYSLVNIFATASPNSATIGTTTTMSAGFLASSLIAIAFFVVNVYFNVQYVLRAVSVAILFAIAPLAIVTLAFGGKFKTVYSNCMKQLIGNIFLQSFHALFVAFFTSITSAGRISTFEMLVVFFAFIPLTNFIKQQIFGIEGGVLNEAGNIASKGMNIVGSAVGGFVGGSIGGSIGKGGPGPSGGGGGSTLSTDTLSRTRKTFSTGNSVKATSGETFDGSNPEKTGSVAKNAGEKAVNVASGGKAGMVSNAIKGTAKAGSQVAKGLGGVGLSMGAMAIGSESRGMNKFAMNSFGNAMNEAKGAFSVGSDLNKAGMSKINETDNQLLYTSKANADGQFSDESFNASPEAETQRDIADAFIGRGDYEGNEELRASAVAHYKKQGVDSVGISKSKNGEHLVFAMNKSTLSQRRGGATINSVSQTQRFDKNKMMIQQRRIQEANAMKEAQFKKSYEQKERHHQERMNQMGQRQAK